ncbi:MAG: hypothetical protein ACTSPM_05915 [Candidatus Heimdallarchaeota archaeon]
MNDYTSLSLPLFLIQNSPLLIYVIDDHLFTCFERSSFGSYGNARSFNSLLSLFSQSKLDKKIPTNITQHFKSKSAFTVEPLFDFMIGGKDYYDDYFLDFSLSISSKENSVLLNQFNFNNHPLPYQVDLSTEDAFYILANHLVNTKRSFHIFNQASQQIQLSSHSKEVLSSSSAHQLSKYKQAIISFISDYLNYIHNQLISRKISPFELLRLNGIGSLELFVSLPIVQSFLVEIFTQLLDSSPISTNQKIMYYSLITMIGHYWFFDDPLLVEEFFSKKDAILSKIWKEIKTPLSPELIYEK